MINNKKKNTKIKRKLSKVLKGSGDYNMSSNEYNQLINKLSNIESKIPNVKNGLSNVGSKIGGLFGLGELGKNLGEGASKLLGFGDYKVVSNSLMKGMQQNGGDAIPKFSASNNGIRIVESEYLGDILSSVVPQEFLNTKYRLNPADPVAFPWLSTIAQQFDQWRPNGIVFEFRTTSSDFNGSAQGLGSVIMATDYDVDDPVYSSKISMTNSDYACSTKPSNDLFHGVECDPKQRPTELLYVLSPNSRTNSNLYSLGNFQVATTGVSAAAVVLGELWVSYDITFFKKQLEPGGQPWCNITGDFTFFTAGNREYFYTMNPQTEGYWRMEDITVNGLDGKRIYFPPFLHPAKYEVLVYITSNLGGVYESTLATTLTTSAFGTNNTVNAVLDRVSEEAPASEMLRGIATWFVYTQQENAYVDTFINVTVNPLITYSISYAFLRVPDNYIF